MSTRNHIYFSLLVKAYYTYSIISIDNVILFDLLLLRKIKSFIELFTLSLKFLLDIFLNLLLSSLILFFHCIKILSSYILNKLSSFRNQFHKYLRFFVSNSFCSSHILLSYSISFLNLSLINVLLSSLYYLFILFHIFLSILL